MQTKKELIKDNSELRVALANLIVAVRDCDKIVCPLCDGRAEMSEVREGFMGWGPVKHGADCMLLKAYLVFGDEVVDVEKVIL